MANVTVDNQVISHVLKESQSLTVPNGQVWKVMLMNNNTQYLQTHLNGNSLSNTYLQNQQIVLRGGDVVRLDSPTNRTGTMLINGFRIK